MNLSLIDKKVAKILFVVVTISFLWFGIFGLSNHMSNMPSSHPGDMGANMAISKCLFNGQAEMCGMNFLEHIDFWESVMTALPQWSGLLGILVLIMLFVSVVISRMHESSLIEFLKNTVLRQRLYLKQHPQTRLFNVLIEAFSGGLINPKIYASTI